MGFLQQDSNNILLDAVLTDTGRQLLARNDGSFSIAKFALGDDEVDYTVIKQYGRTIGKEKLEKNTPVFEAMTNQGYAQKYKLVSVSNPNLLRLPSLAITGQGVDSTNRVVTIGNTTIKSRDIKVEQTITNESSIDIELRDQSFIIELSNLFLQIVGKPADNTDSQQRSTYVIGRDGSENSLGGSQLTFRIATRAITDSQFQIYGAKYNKNLISTFVKVSGIQSGGTIEFEVQITKST